MWDTLLYLLVVCNTTKFGIILILSKYKTSIGDFDIMILFMNEGKKLICQ